MHSSQECLARDLGPAVCQISQTDGQPFMRLAGETWLGMACRVGEKLSFLLG